MNTNKIKNDLFLKALNGEEVNRPPVWMMRQAGRFLPDFRAIAKKYDFFTRCQTPELATEITVMPIDQIGTDAAIIFSDILVIPQAMGMNVEMVKGRGPVLKDHIIKPIDIEKFNTDDIAEKLDYVVKALLMTKNELNNRVPLIGFAGSPWTIFCYMVEGHGSKDFSVAKSFAFTHPESTFKLLQMITNATIEYLNAQIEAGVNAIQIFDSWGGMLSPRDYDTFSLDYIQQIIEKTDDTHKIIFGKGCWYALEKMSKMDVSALGVDWTLEPKLARQFTKNSITLQGNFDPSRLLSPIPEIKKLTKQMIHEFGKNKYIANLGHGILPTIPVENAQAFVDTIKEYSE